jgi:hypothetical protein
LVASSWFWKRSLGDADQNGAGLVVNLADIAVEHPAGLLQIGDRDMHGVKAFDQQCASGRELRGGQDGTARRRRVGLRRGARGRERHDDDIAVRRVGRGAPRQRVAERDEIDDFRRRRSLLVEHGVHGVPPCRDSDNHATLAERRKRRMWLRQIIVNLSEETGAHATREA